MRFHATDKGNVPFTPQEEIERDREEAAAVVAKAEAEKAQAVADIKAELLAADLKIIRALTEGDTAGIKAHVEAQAILRTKMEAELKSR